MNRKEDAAGVESRRKFMKSMALTGGGVAVAATVGQASAAPLEAEAPAEAAATGYHETQHIRDYYTKAQF
jgi:nitrous oxide reductase